MEWRPNQQPSTKASKTIEWSTSKNCKRSLKCIPSIQGSNHNIQPWYRKEPRSWEETSKEKNPSKAGSAGKILPPIMVKDQARNYHPWNPMERRTTIKIGHQAQLEVTNLYLTFSIVYLALPFSLIILSDYLSIGGGIAAISPLVECPTADHLLVL